ncbi:purine nucleoside phosphorylase LACC1 isoform X2 [Stigmatopora nigra]
MAVAVLLDLAHPCGCGGGCGGGCAERLLRQEAARAGHGAHLLLLSSAEVGVEAAEAAIDAWRGGGGGGGGRAQTRGQTRVLSDWRPDAASAYRLKCTVDELGALCLCVITSRRGRARLTGYERSLFGPLYAWTYVAGCRPDPHHAPTHLGEADDDVATYLGGLPPVDGPVRLLTSPLIPGAFGHGFSGRSGGVSWTPTLSSLNLVASPKRRDSPAVVRENRRRLAVAAGFYPRPLQMLKVEHGVRVWVCGRDQPERYDAAVTDRPGTVLAAPGADCVPLIFADPVAGAVGVAHAGWRGTLLGVAAATAAATVAAMSGELGCSPRRILVASGPSVGPCCFALEPRHAVGFPPECVGPRRAGGLAVDLRLANRLQLQEAGIAPHHIHDDQSVAPCTACRPRDFFSRERDGVHFGSQAGFVWIREEKEREGEREVSLCPR